MPRFKHYDYDQDAMVVINYQEQLQPGVNIPVSVAPLIRVFRPLVFRQVFPWRQVFQ